MWTQSIRPVARIASVTPLRESPETPYIRLTPASARTSTSRCATVLFAIGYLLPLANEDVFGQERGDEHVGNVDELTDLEVDGDAADGVGLLPCPPALGQVVDHVEQRVAGRERDVLRLIDAVSRHGDASDGIEAARCGKLGRQVVVLPRKPGVADPLLSSLALTHAEANMHGRVHFDRGAARLAVALGEVSVPRGEQRARDVDRDQ